MINDPLLPTSTPHRQDATKTPQQERNSKRTRRSPARSAKILTLGLSTTAMLGMSSGYAFADLAQKGDSANPTPTQTSPIVSPEVTPPTPAPVATISPGTTTAAVTPPQSAVIEVAVPSGGATPGGGNTAWKKQKSSGSK